MPTLQITFDAADPGALAAFWAAALDYEVQRPPDGYDSWEAWAAAHGIPGEDWNDSTALVDPQGNGPRIYLQRVPEPKSAKNRVHLDLTVGGGHGTPLAERRRRVRAAVRRLSGLGAREIGEVEQRGEYWVVMQDPEGNEFCLQ